MGRTRQPKPFAKKPARGLGGVNETNGRALGIIRVSSTKQKDNNSPPVQREGITEYIDRRKLNLVDVVEIRESAADASARKKFQAVLHRARTEEIRHLVFWVWDRTTRNMTDYEALEKEILADVFELHVANDGRVLCHDSPDSDWLAAEFGTSRIPELGKGLGEGIRNFKKSVKGDEEEKKP